MIRLSEEVLFFARIAAFGLIVGAVYWFVAYEPAGTVMLLGFGVASSVAVGHPLVEVEGGRADGRRMADRA